MSIFARFLRTVRNDEKRRAELVALLSKEVREHGAETELARELQAKLAPPTRHPFAKEAATMRRQRRRHGLRAWWYANYAQTNMPRKERRKLARAHAAGEFRKNFAAKTD